MDEIFEKVHKIQTYYDELTKLEMDEETEEDASEIKLAVDNLLKQLNMVKSLKPEDYPKSIVHDLRSPIGGISGFAEIMLDADPLTDEQYKIVESIHVIAVELRDMVTSHFRQDH